ncbi:DUF4179 domain-containing protein [Lysinibacillus irui]|uniref:DUF4179 domain-containing protein n=1 Tax=Lysinibacillus irui TaxID=2998077 RepID=A0ABU5NQU3_9BACI|nr:DUF4179 domain-containing protein [Lysinibacillus irui]MEA0552459.1 DUF4179 domain-containing protein [Lysinibacillus irui]MEA0978411.1 DUF4179 domain-containing protein [Lysinibacillus irui]MEA1044565.1 DUF4179 domain-containing protein [Lysinibacillus irui]
MERIEKKLKSKMKTTNNVQYPDFDQMWSSIQKDELKTLEEPIELRPRRRKKFALIAGLAVALMATPVYAALNYDWSNILSYREGIQSALEQGLGQKVEQSVTKSGFMLTVHTVFIDENRTFLLYSLKPDASWKGKDVSFDQIGLTDSNGDFIKGNYAHLWNEDLGLFQGYFETDWVADDQKSNINFSMKNIHSIGNEEKSINYNPNDTNTQVFTIQKDGIDNVTIQAFEQPEGKILLQSAVTFTDAKMKNKWVRIKALDDKNQPIQEAETPVFGTPGATDEYLSQQIFTKDSLKTKGSNFQLAYEHTLGVAEDTWSIEMNLTKEQLKKGSFRKVVNIPLENVPGGTKIHEMKVTPTQVRLILTSEERYAHQPYMDYQLDIGGVLLDGGRWDVENDPYKVELRFEMTGVDVSMLAKQSITLVAKHRVDVEDGDHKPIRLTDISEKPQIKTSTIGEFPITWTYYKKDNNLYVESFSSDPTFGGVSQTYYLDHKDRNYGMPLTVGFLGDNNNKNIDEYKNFKGKDLDIYVWKYTTNHPDAELRVPLQSLK